MQRIVAGERGSLILDSSEPLEIAGHPGYEIGGTMQMGILELTPVRIGTFYANGYVYLVVVAAEKGADLYFDKFVKSIRSKN